MLIPNTKRYDCSTNFHPVIEMTSPFSGHVLAGIFLNRTLDPVPHGLYRIDYINSRSYFGLSIAETIKDNMAHVSGFKLQHQREIGKIEII